VACGCTGSGGRLSDGDAGAGDAVDARVKADSKCQYDVDALSVSVDGGGDPCAS
jgi:hypothetical protein